MKKLYAPWRDTYSLSVAGKESEHIPTSGCVFCSHFNETNDSKNFIIRRFKHCVVMLNLYPYNAGHLLILPHKHIANLSDMSKDARAELIELANHSTEIVKKILKTDGCNVGLNLGRAAGAGIPSHLHLHVLPRFTGDTNFLPLIADVKIVSFDLHDIYKQLKPSFDALVI
jgi:ATP adenylyltransferase